MPNAWVEHIRDYSAKNKISYGEAMKHHMPELRESYHARKTGGSVKSDFRKVSNAFKKSNEQTRKAFVRAGDEIKDTFETGARQTKNMAVDAGEAITDAGQQTGDVLRRELYDKPKEITDALFLNKFPLTNAFKDMVKRFGNNRVVHIQVVRTPLGALKGVMNVALTQGQLDKNLQNKPYDTLYHLAMRVSLDSGMTLVVEKSGNAVIHTANAVQRDSQTFDIPVGSSVSFSQLMQGGINAMGRDFNSYDSIKNNCQRFIATILQASNLLSQQAREFIVQDVNGLFSKGQRGFMRSVTDTYGKMLAVKNTITK